MGSVSATHSIATDIWHLAYSPIDNQIGQPADSEYSNGELVPEGDWTAFVSPFSVDLNAGIGLVLSLESGDRIEYLVHNRPPPDEPGLHFIQFPDREITLRVECKSGILTFSHSLNQFDWTEVASYSPVSPVSEVGVVLRYDTPDFAAGGLLGGARLLTGIWQNVLEEVWLGEPAQVLRAAPRDVQVEGFTSTAEPLVHVIVGAQFGDLEFDIGKSVRWVTWFCDNVFVLDINLGSPRYWIVNWAETFPDAKHTVTGINYFVLPTEFRKEQWAQYKLAFGEPGDNDWFLFLDGHEGMGVDNRTLPDDYGVEPFKSYLWREIQRAIDAGQSYAVLPYYVFLRSDNITNVSYVTQATLSAEVDNVLQALSVPYYQAHQGQKRLWNAAELKKPTFDWSQIDTPVTASAAAKLQILSYGYAHWNLQDIEPPETTVPPLTADNDDGWRMRNLLSKVRPIPGLPIGDTWVSPASDPVGLPGPWAPADTNNPDPIDPVTGAPMSPPVPPDSSLLGLVTPLYDCVFRINMRDGVWYEENESGNIPLIWDAPSQTWTTNYDPAQWADRGVESYDPYAVPAP